MALNLSMATKLLQTIALALPNCVYTIIFAAYTAISAGTGRLSSWDAIFAAGTDVQRLSMNVTLSTARANLKVSPAQSPPNHETSPIHRRHWGSRQVQSNMSTPLSAHTGQNTVYNTPTPTDQKQTTVPRHTARKTATVHKLSSLLYGKVSAHREEKSTMNTLEEQPSVSKSTQQWITENRLAKLKHVTNYDSAHQNQTTEYTSISYEGLTATQVTTVKHALPGQHKASVTTQDMLNCLESGPSPLTLQAEEVWLRLDYTGNVSGAPHLHTPATCQLQVRGQGNGIMSLLIFNVTCFADNRLEVHSRMQHRDSYDCDPALWMAPGVELIMTSNFANVSIEIYDANTAFRLQARFKIVPDDTMFGLEIRKVTKHLGR